MFYLVFEGNFPSTSPRGLIFGGAYFRNFRVFRSKNWNLVFQTLSANRASMMFDVCERLIVTLG